MSARAHHHSTPRGPALHGAARLVLQQAGEQWTQMRGEVFEALAQMGRAVSAYDLTEAMSAARGKRVAANSIYRILDLFVAHNLALRVESLNAYIVNTHPGCVHDCIFLVCDSCHSASHMDDDLVTRAVRRAATRDGFRPERPVIEIRGLCKSCAQKST